MLTQDDIPTKKPEDGHDVEIGIGNISGVSGQVNAAGGNIVHAEAGATVIIGSSTEAASGLVALRELIRRSSDVRTSVVEFETDFKVAHELIDRLGDYKDLHDLLHDLQFHCYNGVAQAVTRFPNDEQTLGDLNQYALTLEDIAEKLKQVASRPSIPNQESAWIEDVRTANTELHSALDELSETWLKKVIWRLNRLLAIQPARINTLLNRSAHDLHLPVLLNALARVSEYLDSHNLDTDNVTAFQSGVAALRTLDQTLAALVDEHDHWQALDVELRRIAASIDINFSELEMSWPDVKLMAEPLYIGIMETWADGMRKDSVALEKALSDNNPAKVPPCFRNYQRRATDRFFRVDIDLKSQCGNLRQIGLPLASVLEILE